MKYLLYIILLIAAFAFTANAQTTDLQTTGTQLEVCSQRLLKSLDALSASESLTASLKAENAARAQESAINVAINGQQQKLIELLTKNNRKKLSILFGLISVKY